MSKESSEFAKEYTCTLHDSSIKKLVVSGLNVDLSVFCLFFKTGSALTLRSHIKNDICRNPDTQYVHKVFFV